MIHIHSGGRRSGKTQWLIKQYLKNPGLFISRYPPGGAENICNKNLFTRLPRGPVPSRYIYIDEVGCNPHTDYSTIIELDTKGYNVYITGLVDIDINNYGYLGFLRHLKTHYPEHII